MRSGERGAESERGRYPARVAQTRTREQFVVLCAPGAYKECMSAPQAAAAMARGAISGVSADEETLNLIQFQRQYQAAARFINIVDEMLQTLLSIV